MKKNEIKAILIDRITIGIISGVICFCIGYNLIPNKKIITVTNEPKEVKQLNFDSNKAKETNTEIKETNTEIKEEDINKKKNELPTMDLNTPINIKGGENEEFNITVESVQLTNKKDPFNDNAKHTILVNYSYENINSSNNIDISDRQFKVMDDEGNVLKYNPFAVSVGNNSSVPIGGKAKGTVAFSLETNSKNIKILFYNDSFSSNPIWQMDAPTGL